MCIDIICVCVCESVRAGCSKSPRHISELEIVKNGEAHVQRIGEGPLSGKNIWAREARGEPLKREPLKFQMERHILRYISGIECTKQ